MQIGNKKKSICFLLIFAMLLSGAFWGSAEADSLIMEQNRWDSVVSEDGAIQPAPSIWNFQKKFYKMEGNRENPSRMQIPKGQSFSPEIRMEELTTRNISVESIKTTGKLRQKTGAVPVRVFDGTIEENILFLYPNTEQNAQIQSNVTIVRYIHQKDGKKEAVHMLG